MSLEWDSFGGRLGGPRPLAPRPPLTGEKADEARVQNGSDDGANDRGCQVQPGITEIAGRDHRAKRPRRIEGRAREGAAHEDVEGQGHSDRQRCNAAGAACNRSAEYDCKEEKAEYGLDRKSGGGREREGLSAQSEVVRECRRPKASIRAAQPRRQKDRADDPADELT